jgi:histidine triad (HIT) family protein
MTVEAGSTDEDRRKHLDFIQAVVTRMSAASSSSKAWLLPVVTVAYGYALTRNAESVALLGIAALLLFLFLDVNYLRQEQAYRRLYDAVAKKRRDVPLFSLDPSDADDPIPDALSCKEKSKRLVRRWFPEGRTWLSWSIAPFYGSLLVVGVVIFFRALSLAP